MATTPELTNRILVVEDDPAIRRMMTTHFRRNGYNVEYAMSAEEVAPDEPYDLVVTDVHLPGESGVELAKRMRAAQPSQPVVFMTGDLDERVAREALSTGAAGYLVKPFEFFELDAVVNHVLRTPSAPTITPHCHVTMEAPVLLSPRRFRRRHSAARLRMAVAAALMTAAAWGVGALATGGETPAVSTSQVVGGSDGRTQTVVPIIVDKTVYLNQ